VIVIVWDNSLTAGVAREYVTEEDGKPGWTTEQARARKFADKIEAMSYSLKLPREWVNSHAFKIISER